MARIPLDGFLLSPVQKVCRYPVQLQELLEHTAPGHADHAQLQLAVDAMKRVVRFIDERKRKSESVEMLAMLQTSINDWQVTRLICAGIMSDDDDDDDDERMNFNVA